SNGAMEVIPGTHLKQQPHRDTFAQDNMLSRGQKVAVDVDPGRAVTLALQPGEMSLHHVRIVHGSAPNRSGQRRFGYVTRYIPTYVQQIDGRHNSATLVRGVDEFRSFEHEPIPTRDMEPSCVAFWEMTRQRSKASNLAAKQAT